MSHCVLYSTLCIHEHNLTYGCGDNVDYEHSSISASLQCMLYVRGLLCILPVHLILSW